MIKSVSLGEELIITTENKIGLLADISMMLSSEGINIEACSGFEIGHIAKLMLVTDGNLRIVSQLKKKRYKDVKEVEVVVVGLANKPGALKVVTTALENKKIDIKHLYVTASSSGDYSKMVLQTGDNESAIAVLSKFIEK